VSSPSPAAGNHDTILSTKRDEQRPPAVRNTIQCSGREKADEMLDRSRSILLASTQIDSTPIEPTLLME